MVNHRRLIYFAAIQSFCTGLPVAVELLTAYAVFKPLIPA